MAIEYIEVRSKQDREKIGIIDTANSIIWHELYFGCGDFEVYVPATQRNLELLQVDNYITRPDDDVDEIKIGIIENIAISVNAQDGKMIVASGHFAKIILNRRQIYNLSGTSNKATILRGNVETQVRKVVSDNAISCSFNANRNMPMLELGTLHNIPLIIVDDSGHATQKQVSYQNLLEYTDSVLEEYGLGAKVTLKDDTAKLQYSVYAGADRSVDNTDGNEPIIFSPEFDNLNESNYSYDNSEKKTAALIGGEGEGLARFYSVIEGAEQGLERRETWVDASDISKSYDDGSETEQEYTDAEYKAMLDAKGKQELATLIETEAFDGSLNVTGGVWRFNEDYKLGDIVTIQVNELGRYANVRIVETLERQDGSGYQVDVTYQIFEG